MANRDSKGRFVKGNQAAKNNKGGRPRRETEQDYLRLTVAKTPPDKWAKVVTKAVSQAIGGDHRARQWLGDILIGKYAQVDVTSLNESDRAFIQAMAAAATAFIPEDRQDEYDDALAEICDATEQG